MDTSSFSLDPSFLTPAGLIEQVLEEAFPLQSDLVGRNTIHALVKGQAFGSVPGGRHLNLTDTIGFLSSVVGLVQCAIQVVVWLKKRKTQGKQLSEAEVRTVIEIVRDKAPATDVTLVLSRDPRALVKVISVLLEILDTDNV